MNDPAHKATDERIDALSRKISGTYSRAEKELATKVNSFFANFAEADREKKKQVDAGKMTATAYRAWRKQKIMVGDHYKQLQKQVSETMLGADKEAARLINRELPRVAAMNYNQVGKDAESTVKGYSFEMINDSTVQKLMEDKSTILPYKEVDGQKIERWNTEQVNAEVLQGIVQGESAYDIAKRLTESITGMEKSSAIRNARTAVTSAENAGRQAGMLQLQEDGAILKKEWIAAVDDRTREAHLELNGQQVDVDKDFHNSIGYISYPGDPNADPANVYNCRCTMRTVVVGFRKKSQTEVKKEEKKEEKKKEKTEEKPKSTEQTMAGVERGEPMTHAQADTGNVNPHFGEEKGYNINCQSCVMTYEARMRGYDVEVVANDSQHPMCRQLSMDTSLALLDKDGNHPGFEIGSDSWKWAGAWTGDAPTAKRFEKMLKDTLDEDARYTLQFKWKGFNAGHIVMLEKDGSDLVIYDPQSNRTMRGSYVTDYLNQFQYQRTVRGNRYYQYPGVRRVDDKQFDFGVKDKITKKKEGAK